MCELPLIILLGKWESISINTPENLSPQVILARNLFSQLYSIIQNIPYYLHSYYIHLSNKKRHFLSDFSTKKIYKEQTYNVSDKELVDEEEFSSKDIGVIGCWFPVTWKRKTEWKIMNRIRKNDRGRFVRNLFIPFISSGLLQIRFLFIFCCLYKNIKQEY